MVRVTARPVKKHHHLSGNVPTRLLSKVTGHSVTITTSFPMNRPTSLIKLTKGTAVVSVSNATLRSDSQSEPVACVC